MKIVFMGTPDFAVPCLQKLISGGHQVAGVFTQPDKPVGRKQVLTAPPVKACALQNKIPVYQPAGLKDGSALKILRELAPDIIIVVAYGKILPREILQCCSRACINVHASLLPKYRGAAPIQWAVLNGEKTTGITVMQMDEGLDTGDILLQQETEIGINETSESLYQRLSKMGASALLTALDAIESNTAVRRRQPDGDYGYASMISKGMSPIDWSCSAFQIHNQIRGLQTWPCAVTTLNGKNLKIHKSVLSGKSGAAAGEVVGNRNVLTVCCGDGNCLDILELQADGKKRMDTKSFLLGNNIDIGTILGE